MFRTSTLTIGGIALAVGTAGTASLAASADEATVVVTATRSPTRLGETLSDVTVLHRESFGVIGQHGLVDILHSIPGVEISATGGAGQPATVFLRGTNGAHALVLIDGIRINSATLGTAALEHIPVSEIERIEVLRGQASSLYGADAIGGVIQLITRRGDGDPAFFGSFGVGSYNTAQGNLGFSGKSGSTRFSLHGAYGNTKGFNAVANPAGAFGAWNRDRDGYRNESVSGQISHDVLPGHEIGLTFFQSDGVAKKDALNCDRATGFATCTASYDSRTLQQLQNLSFFSRNRISERWRSTLQVGRSRDDMRDLRFDPATVTEFQDHFRTEQTQAIWQNDLRLGPGNFMFAIEKLEQRLTASGAYPVKSRHIDSLLAGYHGWFGNHGIQLNVRRDTNSQFGAKTTGGATYGYQISPEWKAMAGVKTAFRAPSFNDLYFPYQVGIGGGNANVRPEKAAGQEIAVHYDSGPSSTRLTWHKARISDLIDWAESPIGSWEYFPFNVNRAEISGWSFSQTLGWNDWLLRASLDLQNAQNTVTRKQLVNRAKEFGAVSVSRKFGDWQTGVEVRASGARFDDQANLTRLGGYSVTNLTLDYTLRNNWAVFARANNVFDKGFELRRDYAVAGRSVFVGVRYDPRQ